MLRAVGLRSVALLTLLAVPACDQIFQLTERPPDAATVDATGDAPPPDAAMVAGCADGSREALMDVARFPRIAGCGGAWDGPGVIPAQAPSCGHAAGNHGTNVRGAGCNVSDLCAPGWEVCRDRLAVLARITPRQTCADLIPDADLLFITGQSGPGGGRCDETGINDLFGCGGLGPPADGASCAPLTTSSSNDCFEIRDVGGWRCTEPGEATNVTKADPLRGGGVLCCAPID